MIIAPNPSQPWTWTWWLIQLAQRDREIKHAMRVAVAGSRRKFWRDVEVARAAVELAVEDALVSLGATEVGHGGNYDSVDAVAEEVARRMGLPVHVFAPSSWTRDELLRRNRELVDWADAVVVVYVDEETPGTAYVENYAMSVGKPVRVYFVESSYD